MGFKVNNFILEVTWGAPIGNGSWDGLLGNVKDGKTDIGVGHVGMVWPRAQIIDYTAFTYYLEVGHKTRKPIPVNAIFNIFTPYTTNLWISLVIAIFIASICFAISAKLGPYWHIFHWIDFGIMPLSMLMESSMLELEFFKKVKKTKNGFILLSSWTIATFFFVKAYESNLLASLLAKVYEKPIDSFQDMLDAARPVYYTRGSTVVRILQTSPYEARRKVFQRVIDNDHFFEGSPDNQILQQVLDKGIIIQEFKDGFNYNAKEGLLLMLTSL